MHELKTKNVDENFSRNKEIFTFTNYSTNSKYYGASTKLVIENTKREFGAVAITECA